jgi:hypothetical protein
MYTLQGKIRPTCHTLSTLGPHMSLDHTYLTWSTHSNLSLANNRVGQSHYFQEKGISHAGWSIYGSPSSFSPTLNQRSCGESQTSVDDRLLGLHGPYHRHAIGTFNTRSRGPTHWSLTDTGGGYNLVGAIFPHTTLRPSQPVISTFHLRAPPGLQFNHFLPEIPKLTLRTLWLPRGLSTTQLSTVTYIYA